MLMCTFVLNVELLNPIRFELCLLLGIVLLFVLGAIIYGFFRERMQYIEFLVVKYCLKVMAMSFVLILITMLVQLTIAMLRFGSVYV